MPAMFVMNQFEESDGSSRKRIYKTKKMTAGKDVNLQSGDRVPEGALVYRGTEERGIEAQCGDSHTTMTDTLGNEGFWSCLDSKLPGSYPRVCINGKKEEKNGHGTRWVSQG
jgi:hypothetical protein